MFLSESVSGGLQFFYLAPWVVFFPVIGLLVNAFFGGKIQEYAALRWKGASGEKTIGWLACAAVGLSFMVSLLQLVSLVRYPEGQVVPLADWITIGALQVRWAFQVDTLSVIMMLVVSGVGLLIHIYSIGYMHEDVRLNGDPGRFRRFFVFMNLFIATMMILVTGDNYMMLFVGWEGVGLCSYLLIGFWYEKGKDGIGNALAAKKAFVVNRIGDLGFMLAAFIMFWAFGSFEFHMVFAKASQVQSGIILAITLFMLVGVTGKSAQLPLFVWLPDAMAGPTPVSALIHAATMVTAGAYLLMRLFPVIVLSSVAMVTIATVAAFTGLFSALAALGQKDIKRILAYSTISQVSYMFLSVGAGDVTGGMYHLLSHAFFKALLFLGAGCVIQALHEEHDIFKMGNLRRRLPVVFWLYLVGSVSLAAIPPFGGFFSKDRILLSTFSHPEPIYKLLGLIAEIGALITVLYTFRMFFVAFLDRPSVREDFEKRDLKIPKFMAWINSPLAILAIFAGALNFPEAFGGKSWLAQYLASIPGGVPPFPASASLERSIEIGSGLLNIAVLIVAYFLYRPEGKLLGWPTPVVLRQRLEELLSSGFYLDRLYQIALVKPYRTMARTLWLNVDERAVDDRFDATANVFRYFSFGLQLWTTGRLSTYLKMLLLGFTAIVSALALGWYYLR